MPVQLHSPKYLNTDMDLLSQKWYEKSLSWFSPPPLPKTDTKKRKEMYVKCEYLPLHLIHSFISFTKVSLQLSELFVSL